jgi:pyruvate kinase
MLANYRLDDRFEHVDEAIAMAAMYTANHLAVKAIVALTESGSTPLWMSRVRSSIPIFAFTPHDSTERRVTLYRGVYPVPFDVASNRGPDFYEPIYSRLLADGIVERGDRILLTKGERQGISGGTNTMHILTVPTPEPDASIVGD